ncbi:cysteine hydrolase family protein, partial [Candidatus Omnitrophota bacterium]
NRNMPKAMIEPLVTLEEKVDPQRAVILVIDVVNSCMHPEGTTARLGLPIRAAQEMVPRLVKFLEEADKYKVRKVFIHGACNIWKLNTAEVPLIKAETVNISFSIEEMINDPWEQEFYLVKTQPDDLVIEKWRFDAFVGTPLDMALKAVGARSVLLTGVGTGGCVESTQKQAFSLGYHTVIVENCCQGMATSHEAAVRRMSRHGTVVSYEEVAKTWEKMTREK